jgi:hypothetical protein
LTRDFKAFRLQAPNAQENIMSTDKGFFHRALNAIIESRTLHAEAQIARYSRTFFDDSARPFIQDQGR